MRGIEQGQGSARDNEGNFILEAGERDFRKGYIDNCAALIEASAGIEGGRLTADG